MFRFGDEDIRKMITVNVFLLKLTYFFTTRSLIFFLTAWFFMVRGGRGGLPPTPLTKKNPLSGIFVIKVNPHQMNQKLRLDIFDKAR